MANKKQPVLVASPASAVKDWQMDLRQAMFDAVTDGDVREIVQGLIKRAKEGDIGATKLLLTYLVGGPSISVRQAVFVQPSHEGPAQADLSKLGPPKLPAPEPEEPELSGRDLHDPREIARFVEGRVNGVVPH